MSFKFTFREITPEDTEILRILKLRNAKPEEHICCEILRGDGITMKTWYSKADVALWGEDYIKANSKMKYIDGDWTVSLDVEPWKRTHGVSSKKVTSPSSPRYPTWLTGHVKEWAEKRLPTVTLCSTTGNELLEVWYYGDLLTVKGEPQSYIVDGSPAPGLVVARDPEGDEEFVIFDVDGMATTICSAMNMIHLSWSTVPSSGMRSLPPNWCWSWVTVSTMRTKKRTSNRMKRVP